MLESLGEQADRWMSPSHDNQLSSRSRAAVLRSQIPVVSELNAWRTPDQGLVVCKGPYSRNTWKFGQTRSLDLTYHKS